MVDGSPLLWAVVLLGFGVAMRTLELASLVVGVTTPVADPELTAEFVGDFIVATSLLLGGLAGVDRLVGLPEAAWLGFGAVVVLGVAATPVLAGWYVRWRTQGEIV